MKQSLPIAAIAMGAMLAGGCATKKYVGQQIDPVSQRVNQVSQQTNQQGQKLDQTASSLEKDETELSATNERAVSADNKAGDAMNRADQASQKADQVGRDLGDLRNTVANLDDYKQVGQTTVNFKFNSDRLEADAKAQLDQMASGENQYKRFFIAVEGFTDSVGTTEYNNALSRRRADAVVQYLVAEHNIPVYRIHMIGMGKDKPLDDAKTRAARARNRRVEVTLYSADQSPVAMNQSASGATASPQQ
jgi:outer membrane protein OmpA-like peptidoglycan-associated protein